MGAAKTFDCGGIAFDLRGIDIRNLQAGPVHLLDHIYVGVRDRNWNTIEANVGDLTRSIVDDGVRITFVATNVSRTVDLAWRGQIDVTADGVLTYEMRGDARADFDFCRIGFCLLYPERTMRGRDYRAQTVSGLVAGSLPDLIAPQTIVDGVEQALFPAFSALTVDAPDAILHASFEGDLFEIEDQRNWTDASFKVYCTPIALGYPHHAHRGQQFFQRVTVSAEVASASQLPAPVNGGQSDAAVVIDLSVLPVVTPPEIGLGSSTALTRPMDAREIDLIGQLRLGHLRIDVHPEDERWAEMLIRAVADARAVDTSLLVALHTGADAPAQVREVAALLDGDDLARLLVLDAANHGTATTPSARVSLVRRALEQCGVTPQVGGGTDGDFAELNRDRPSMSGLDFVAYAMNPQVHVFDDASILSTLSTQASTVRTAVTFTEQVPVVVGPVTLRPRFNPSATGPEDPVPDGVLPPTVDHRQSLPFTAAWTLGSITALAESGAAAVTYHETVGWRGVLERTDGDLPPDPLLSRPGRIWPVFHVLRDLADRVAGSTWTTALEAQSGYAAVGFATKDAWVMLLANVSEADLTCVVGPFSVDGVHLRVLDEDSANQAATDPSAFRRAMVLTPVIDHQVRITLAPSAYARLEVPEWR